MPILYLAICLFPLVVGRCRHQPAIKYDQENVQIPDDFAVPMNLPRVSYREDELASDDTRIYYGDRAHDEQLPFHCSLQCFGADSITSYCSCSILATNYVLTAAHCVAHKWWCTVGYGSNYVKDMRRVTARHFYPHPYYNETLLLHDIALIGLTCGSTIEFSDKVKPVVLPRDCDSFVNATGFVAGFGETQKGKNLSRGIFLYTFHCRRVSNLSMVAIY